MSVCAMTKHIWQFFEDIANFILFYNIPLTFPVVAILLEVALPHKF